MKIAVCIKHVPGGPLRIDPGSMRLDRTGDGALNEADATAVEEALRIKEGAGAEVVVVSVGPEPAVASLRRALAMGADRAVLVSDDAAAGSDLVATSRILAAALEREQPDLVLFGQQAADGGGAVLAAAVAERMRIATVSQATELSVESGSARVKRQTEFGQETVELPSPAVIAVSDGINEPRYPPMKGLMQAKMKPLALVTLADLGIGEDEAGDPGSRTSVHGVSDVPRRGDGRKLEGDPDPAAAILAFLVAEELV
ncbi:MAG TPA: electron transfer flavoprotein subunit beta/FixA family protein [Gaiellaceae bacterium]|jgi:electron transfer flavoprotein beta subunit